VTQTRQLFLFWTITSKVTVTSYILGVYWLINIYYNTDIHYLRQILCMRFCSSSSTVSWSVETYALLICQSLFKFETACCVDDNTLVVSIFLFSKLLFFIDVSTFSEVWTWTVGNTCIFNNPVWLTLVFVVTWTRQNV